MDSQSTNQAAPQCRKARKTLTAVAVIVTIFVAIALSKGLVKSMTRNYADQPHSSALPVGPTIDAEADTLAARHGFDVAGARAAGYSSKEIIDYLTKKKQGSASGAAHATEAQEKRVNLGRMSLAQIRAAYPQYDDLSDSELAHRLHATFYSDMPFADFAAAIQLPPQEPEMHTPPAFYECLLKRLPGVANDVAANATIIDCRAVYPSVKGPAPSKPSHFLGNDSAAACAAEKSRDTRSIRAAEGIATACSALY